MKVTIKTAKLNEIKPNKDNPRILRDEKFKKLKQSIQNFPEMLELREVVVDENMIILGGNMRYRALQDLGIKEAQIKIVEGLSEEQKKEFIIKDNVGFGDWDWDLLANEWDTTELEDWGLDLPADIETEELEAQEDDYEQPDQITTDIVLGDLFEFRKDGKPLHRLLCGDSTSVDDVEKLMNGEKAELAHNDPPYGMKKENDGVLNDNLNYDDLLDFNRQWIPLQFTVLKDNGSWYCWGIDEPLMDIYSHILKPYIKEQKATFRNLITWDKSNGQGQMSEDFRMYPIADEKCLFVMCGVQGFNNNADNYFENWEPVRHYLETEIKKLGESDPVIAKALGYKDGRTVNHWWSKSQWAFPTKEAYQALRNYANTKSLDDAFKKEYDELKKEYYSTRAYFNNTHDNQNNVWHFERTGNKEREGTGEHATPKPIALCERAIKSSCPDNGLVLDFFLGSGSTMVASHQLNRRCYGLELDPKYCQVIIDRMKKLDPELEVIKVN
jgi:DNA modification methylase